MSEPQEDTDLEVSALASSSLPPPSESGDISSAPPSSLTTDGESASPQGQRESLAARRSPRQQALRIGSVCLLLALLLAAIFFVPNGNRAEVLRVLTAPTPTAPPILLPGEDAFLWIHSVPWGQLLIDGKPGPNVAGSAAIPSNDQAPHGAVFRLPRGRHTLTYRAAPFPTLTCTVSVPFDREDTCPLDRSDDPASLLSDDPLARVLDLRATVDRLPTAQRQALVERTRALFDALAAHLPAGALAVGDHYQDASGQIEQSTSPLQVTPRYPLAALDTQQSTVNCATVCTANTFGDPESASGWAALAPIALTWRYSTPSGTVVLANGPGLPSGISPYIFVSVRTNWSTGGWQAPTLIDEAPNIDPVICPTAAHALEVSQAPSDFQWRFYASTAELGCVFAGSERDTRTGKPTSPMALVLYRAGAMIAANAEAQRVFPRLPMASPHERALAQAAAPSSLD